MAGSVIKTEENHQKKSNMYSSLNLCGSASVLILIGMFIYNKQIIYIKKMSKCIV